MSLRIRKQTLSDPYKRNSVKIISVDQFTRTARMYDNSKTEREHLLELLRCGVIDDTNDHSTYYIKVNKTTGLVFWLEKQ